MPFHNLWGETTVIYQPERIEFITQRSVPVKVLGLMIWVFGIILIMNNEPTWKDYINLFLVTIYSLKFSFAEKMIWLSKKSGAFERPEGNSYFTKTVYFMMPFLVNLTKDTI